MKIGIVGTSYKVTENEFRDLMQMISLTLQNHDPVEDTVISGGAIGVDLMAEEIGKGMGYDFRVYQPIQTNWLGYKKRNLEIARDCDYVYCFSVPHYDDEKRKSCYHHVGNEGFLPHLKTAGCWTLNEAMKLGKRCTLIVTPRRY